MRSVAAALMVAAMTLSHQPVWAQDDGPVETRPAIPTFWGDTGLWFVPTAETPRPGGMSFSVYRSEFDFNQGFSNVSFWPVTASVGVGDRVEAFGAFRVITRIDRDTEPLFYNNPPAADGGLLNEYPFVHETWTGNDVGDLFAGAKVNLTSQHRNQALAFALRGTIKIPTADETTGAGTGEFDYFTDVILSREISQRIELTGYGGFAFRGDPEQISLSDSFRWGVGAGFGSRGNFRFTTELFGEIPQDDNVTVVNNLVSSAGPLTATGSVINTSDGSNPPIATPLGRVLNTSLGMTWQGAGASLGIGLAYRFDLDNRSDIQPLAEDRGGDALSLQFRVGFHSGVKIYRPPVALAVAPAPPPPPPPVPPAPAPAPAPVINRPPTLSALCDPCQVEVGKTIALRATGQDPDGDRLQYRWSTPAGTIGDPLSAATNWTAETSPGTQVLTVTVDDGRGGTATGRVNVQVVGAVAPQTAVAFDEILFDFDRDTLRPDALAVLQNVLAALRANPQMNLEIDGHASAEGTTEYNMNLGERRAHAVQAYLVSQGIDQSRVSTRTYGEERPRVDNTSEANRALNRRAAFVIVRGQ